MGGKPGEPRPMRGTDRELWALTRAVPVGTDEGQLQKETQYCPRQHFPSDPQSIQTTHCVDL